MCIRNFRKGLQLGFYRFLSTWIPKISARKICVRLSKVVKLIDSHLFLHGIIGPMIEAEYSWIQDTCMFMIISRRWDIHAIVSIKQAICSTHTRSQCHTISWFVFCKTISFTWPFMYRFTRHYFFQRYPFLVLHVYIILTWKIVAAFRGMHVWPVKPSYAWLPRKCDYRTDRHTDRCRIKWSLCMAMLCRRHKNLMRTLFSWVSDFTNLLKNQVLTITRQSMFVKHVPPLWA